MRFTALVGIRGGQTLDVAVSQWQAIRHQVLERDDFRCVSCGAELRSAEADIHHLLPHSMGGTDELRKMAAVFILGDSPR